MKKYWHLCLTTFTMVLPSHSVLTLPSGSLLWHEPPNTPQRAYDHTRKLILPLSYYLMILSLTLLSSTQSQFRFNFSNTRLARHSLSLPQVDKVTGKEPLRSQQDHLSHGQDVLPASLVGVTSNYWQILGLKMGHLQEHTMTEVRAGTLIISWLNHSHFLR